MAGFNDRNCDAAAESLMPSYGRGRRPNKQKGRPFDRPFRIMMCEILLAGSFARRRLLGLGFLALGFEIFAGRLVDRLHR